MEKEADQTSAELAGIVERPLWDFDVQRLAIIGDSITKNNSISNLTLRDGNGEILYSFQRQGESGGVERRVIVRHGVEKIGEIKVMFSQRPYQRQIWLIVQSSALTVALILVSVFLVTGYLVRKQLREPLGQFSRIVGAYAEGEYPDRPLAVSYSEFQQFGTVLAAMGQRIHNQLLQLKTVNAMLAKILDSVPQAVFWKDRDGAYLGSNRVFARDAGLEGPEAIVGKTDYDLPWTREAADAYRADDREVIENNRPKLHIVEMVHQADGTRIWVDTTKAPLTDDSGSVYGVLGVFDDITERKRAEQSLKESEEMLRSIFVSSPDSITVADLDGRIMLCNQAAANIHGFPAIEGLIGKRFHELVAEEDRPRAMEDMNRVMTQGVLKDVPFIGLKNGGEIFPGELSVSVLRDSLGKPRGFVGITKDITERKMAEEELKKQMDELVAWHNVTIGREGRVMELKIEVNELLAKLGRTPRYAPTDA